MTEVIVSGMEAYIPHSFSQSKPSKPWFNTTCFRAIHDREVAHKRTKDILRNLQFQKASFSNILLPLVGLPLR
ncbi:hypothetical protein E2C01_055157 [Portunus trituberculatus]|uniref:Uncharacterized protein n=1 Tax=Portunus trituberculatus TaxID=210409 RepID=A0A5B7GWW4_PORTR|nr:hypothetical protein [Portunus trituberculatus]